MKVLVACEFSGIVRDAFCEMGHDAWSCDLLPTDRPGNHIQGDVLEILNDGWDMMIAHPPCTHLAVSGMRWFKSGHKPKYLIVDALEFVRKLMNAQIHKTCIENPVSVISTKIRRPDQIINPWMFGHAEQKKTCLWLKNLPILEQTNNVYEHMMTLPVKERTRIHWMGSKKGHERSITYTNIAKAMAEQWGGYNFT